MTYVELASVVVRRTPASVGGGHGSCQLIGELLPPGGEFKSETQYVRIYTDFDVWHRLVVTNTGWQLRVQLTPDVPCFLKEMPTDDWRRLVSEVQSGRASLSLPVSFKAPDLQSQKLPGDETIRLADVMSVSVNMHRDVISLDHTGVYGRRYDGIYLGSVKSLGMTSS